MTINQEIGARIKQLRIRNNLTQQELANKLHYKSRSTINKIELGINEIHPTKIYAFAHALNTTPEYILGWKEEPPIEEIAIVRVTSKNFYREYMLEEEIANKIVTILEEHNIYNETEQK